MIKYLPGLYPQLIKFLYNVSTGKLSQENIVKLSRHYHELLVAAQSKTNENK
jgi:hypothetical protein